jgi:hypothetical protein
VSKGVGRFRRVSEQLEWNFLMGSRWGCVDNSIDAPPTMLCGGGCVCRFIWVGKPVDQSISREQWISTVVSSGSVQVSTVVSSGSVQL